MVRLAKIVPWRVRVLAKRFGHRMRETRRNVFGLSQSRILNALANFGDLPSSTLLVHSSLSACGAISGGPATVVQALWQWIGNRNLAMPTHTYCYPDREGKVPLFEVAATRSVVGAITEYYWHQPGVVRSVHPTHSLACRGPGSEELCRGHELCNTPCGKGTPYERLVQQDSSVLMFGATMNTYTLFHTAEDAAELPFLYEPKPMPLKAQDRNGKVYEILMRKQDMGIARRFPLMDTWLEEHGLLVRRKLGAGTLLFIPHARDVHEKVVEELRRDPLFLVADSARTEVARRFRL